MSSLSMANPPVRPGRRKRGLGASVNSALEPEEFAKVAKCTNLINAATEYAKKFSMEGETGPVFCSKQVYAADASNVSNHPPATTMSLDQVTDALAHLKHFAEGSSTVCVLIGTSTSALPNLISFLGALDLADRENRHTPLLIRALEILDALLRDHLKCVRHIVSEAPNCFDILVRILGGVRELTKSWEGMLALDRVCLVLLHCVSSDNARNLFFKAKGGAALLLSVDILCSMAKKQKPEPIYRRGFDVSADSWVQLAKRVCSLVVETAASEKLSNRANLRSLHKAGVFGALCRLMKTLMHRSGEKSSVVRGPSLLLRTQYSKELMLAIHSLISGERDYQRAFLQAGIVPLMIRELFQSWVFSWLGATSPETNDSGEDAYYYFGGPEEAKRVRAVASDAYSKYVGLQLLFAALQYDFSDATIEVESAMLAAINDGVLEQSVVIARKEVGGSVLESFQYDIVGASTTSSQTGDEAECVLSPTKVYKTCFVAGDIEILLASGVVLKAPTTALTSCARWYSSIMDESCELHLYHYDDEACVEALTNLEKTLQEGTEAQHFFVNIRGAVDLLVQNVNQIDENVMRAGCAAAHSLLLGNSVAQKTFLKCNGMRALSDCLHDYDIKVRLLALQSIAILCSKQEQCLDEVRKTGILQHIVSILSDFPADDVNVDVAIAAADVLAHCVNDNVPNQVMVQENNGLATLYKVFEWCVSWRSASVDGNPSARLELPSTLSGKDHALGISLVLENVCSALSNLAFRNESNQNEMLKNGTLGLCISTLCNRAGKQKYSLYGVDSIVVEHASLPCRPLELTLAIFNILINGVDANPAVQAAVGVERTVALLSLFMGPISTDDNSSTVLGLPLFSSDEDLLSEMAPAAMLSQMQKVAAMSCLLLSHLAWDNPITQAHVSSEERILQLVSLIYSGSNFHHVIESSCDVSHREATLDKHSRVNGGIFSVDEHLAGQDEVRLYALMALINLSYHNIIVQNIVNDVRLPNGCTTFDVILILVTNDLFDVRKAAVFCLDNLVSAHRNNCQLLADAGGVLSLVALLNDDDEDEISKKAFKTLSSMSDIALSVILRHIAALSCGVDGIYEGIGSGLACRENMPSMPKKAMDNVANVAVLEKDYYTRISKGGVGDLEPSKWENGIPGFPSSTILPTSTLPTFDSTDESKPLVVESVSDITTRSVPDEIEGEDIGNMVLPPPITTNEVVWGMLGKLLPVVNGIVYNDAIAREFLWKRGNGIPVLLYVMTRDLPLQLRVIASFIIANVTQSYEKELQHLAKEMGAFEVFNFFIKDVNRNGDDSDGEDNGDLSTDCVSIVFTVLYNLVRQNLLNSQQFASPEYSYMLNAMVKCCADGTEPELRNEAANALLAIVELALEDGSSLQTRLLEGDVDAISALQLLGESFDSSLEHSIKARAEQAARELRIVSGDLKK